VRYGLTPSEYLKRAQVMRAALLLRGTCLSTTAIGYRCGFGTRRTFCRLFREITCVTPDAFRKTK
jgi:AraC-like DNA-binding protein